jgi:hypothetical protein
MSNRQFSLTVKATEIIETIPKRIRSKFVSDAIINFIKKKDILNEYIIQKVVVTSKPKIIKQKVDKPLSSETEIVIPIKKKVKIDGDF